MNNVGALRWLKRGAQRTKTFSTNLEDQIGLKSYHFCPDKSEENKNLLKYNLQTEGGASVQMRPQCV